MTITITYEEQQLMALYSSTGTRAGLAENLREMRGHLEADETELRELTESALEKLEAMTDVEFAALDLIPDDDGEDTDAG